VPSSALVRITILNLVAGLVSVITMNVLRLLAAATPSKTSTSVFVKVKNTRMNCNKFGFSDGKCVYL